MKATAGPWCLVVDCLGEVSRQVLGHLCQGPSARSMGEAWLRTDGRMALPWRGVMVCLSVARPRKGPTNSCEASPPPAAGTPPPAEDHRAGRTSPARRTADALLSMPREPPGLLHCLPSLWPWPLRICETALRCSSSLALGKHDRGLFQNLIENLRPATLQEGRPASCTRKGVKDGPYKVDGRALVSRRRLHRRSRSASSWQCVAKDHRHGRWAKRG